MSHLHLISEDSRSGTAPPVERLTESVNGSKRTYITGIFAQSEVVNANRRFYPKTVLEGATREYVKRAVSARNAMALGELNHPEYPKPNAREACHLVTELTIDGNNIVGKAEILEELPNGKIVKSLIDRGITVGVSTRGIGSVTEGTKGVSKVDRYKMFAVDVVTDPSAPEAYVKGLMEAAEWLRESDDVDTDTLNEMSNMLRTDDGRLNAMSLLLSKLSGGRK